MTVAAKLGTATVCGVVGGVGQYCGAVPLAGVVQGAGEGVLGACCGVNVPTEGVELAKAGAEKLLPVTVSLTSINCCISVLSESKEKSGGSSMLAQAAYTAINPLVGIATTEAGKHLTIQEAIKVVGASVAGSASIACGVSTCAIASCVAGSLAVEALTRRPPQYQGIRPEQPLINVDQQAPDQQAPDQVQMSA